MIRMRNELVHPALLVLRNTFSVEQHPMRKTDFQINVAHPISHLDPLSRLFHMHPVIPRRLGGKLEEELKSNVIDLCNENDA